MPLLQDVRQYIERLRSPREELGRWASFLRFQINLWPICVQRLHDNNVMAMSSALSFRTLLAMIPTLVLSFLVLKSTGGLNEGREQLREFLDQVGLSQIVVDANAPTVPGEDDAAPPVGAEETSDGPSTVNLASYIEDLVAQVDAQLTVGRLGPIGVALLVWSALTLLTTMERSLNRIFGARQQRSLWRRTLVYWSVVTLAPLLIAVANYCGETIEHQFNAMQIGSLVVQWLGWLAPIIVEILLLAALYKLMPNTEVRWQAALIGAVIAVPMWLTARWGLGIYVGRLAGSNLYGALGLLPVFLIWLSLSWWIFLFGAQLAHTATHLERFREDELAEDIHTGPLDLLAATVAVAEPFVNGGAPRSLESIADLLGLPDVTVADLLHRLRALDIVVEARDGNTACYVLKRAADRIKLFEILNLAGHQDAHLDHFDAGIARRISGVKAQAEAETVTLADVLQR